MRVFATNHLRFLLRTNVTDISHWGIQLLITQVMKTGKPLYLYILNHPAISRSTSLLQLYDLSAEVCERAVDVLDESFDDPINLESAIKLKPMLLHLGNNADPLLLRFMSTSSGFRFMNEMNYVEHEMDEWYNSGNRSYVAKLESNLARALWSWKLPSKVPVGSETALDAAKQNGLQSEYW